MSPGETGSQAQAGSHALEPLGFQQRGKSLTYFSDERFWICVIEFQSASEESYLNVGAHWLWSYTDVVSFDLGAADDGSPRVDPAILDLADDAHSMAELAADSVAKLRVLLPTVEAAGMELLRRVELAGTESAGWNAYHAAIALGLARDPDTAARLFDAVLDEPAATASIRSRQGDSRMLRAIVDKPARFRAVILERMQAKRNALGFPPLGNFDF